MPGSLALSLSISLTLTFLLVPGVTAAEDLMAQIPEIDEAIAHFKKDDMEEGQKVIALEYFEMKGERKVKFSFNSRDAEGEDVGRISLGSYDTTNAIARQLGGLPEGVRRFHLDGYPPDGSHVTYGFFNGNPGYDTIKPMVVEILKEEREGISRTVPQKDGVKIEIEE